MHKEFFEGFFNSQGARLHYHIHGIGFPLIMLHGNMQSQSYFDRQTEYFRNYFKVITVDSRGHGKSTFGKKKLTIEIMADDILNLMDVLGIENAILLGFSDGGNIALRIAQKQPSKILALIIIGANLYPSGLKARILLGARFTYFITKKISFLPLFDKLNQRMSLMAIEPKLDENGIKKINAPTLLLAGEFDMIKESHTREIANMLKNVELKIIKKAGHFLPSRNAAEINRIIYDFIEKVLRY